MLWIFRFFILFIHFDAWRLKLLYWFQVLLVFYFFFNFKLLVFSWLIFLGLMLFLTRSIFFYFYFINFIKWHFLNLLYLIINFTSLIDLLWMNTMISWWRFSFIQITLLSIFIWVVSIFFTLSLIPPIFVLDHFIIFHYSLRIQFLIIWNKMRVLLS